MPRPLWFTDIDSITKTMAANGASHLDILERTRAELKTRLDEFEVGGRGSKLTDAQVQAASHYARRALVELNKQIAETKRRVQMRGASVHLF